MLWLAQMCHFVSPEKAKMGSGFVLFAYRKACRVQARGGCSALKEKGRKLELPPFSISASQMN